MMEHPATLGKLRIDKWLWAARFFKTRALAAEAIESGKVLLLDGGRIKPARAVAVGDRLDIRAGQNRYEVEVLGLCLRRGPAPEAQQLYRESDESRERRQLLAEQNRLMPQSTLKGRPSKRDRRELDRFIRQT